jgi:hypothetical protein
MGNDQRLTMFQWLFKPETMAHRVLHLGFGGAILLIVAKDIIGKLQTTPGTVSLICILIAVSLGLPALGRNSPPQEAFLKAPTATLAGAYAWISLLYFFKWTGLIKLPAQYDAVTDLCGTLLFIAAWYMFSGREPDEEGHIAERVALTIISLLSIGAGVAKTLIDTNVIGSTADDPSARLVLNFCNAAVIFGLYGQIRRLLPPPDPVTHVLIMLYGCSQLAAPARDCLYAAHPCASPSLDYFVACTIDWSLLMGKIGLVAHTFPTFTLTASWDGMRPSP